MRSDSPETVPSGYTGTSYIATSSRREQNSSGESSVESRIDSTDKWRVSGPGRPPRFPLSTGIPLNLADANSPAFKFWDTLSSRATQSLIEGNFDWRSVKVCGRVSEGQALTDADTTLLISASYGNRRDELVSLLDSLVQELVSTGFPGRVEIIDPKAADGPKIFPPCLTDQQQSHWDEILDTVVSLLGQFDIDWYQVFAANRGYWEDISVATVVVKATVSDSYSNGFRQIAGVVDEYGFCLEVLPPTKMWGLSFAPYGAAHDKDIRTSLEWPFSYDSPTMGMSVGRIFPNSVSSTLGGFLKVSDGVTDHIVGVTCYHGVCTDEHGNIDLDIQAKGSSTVSWPCQSPSPQDINILLEPIRHRLCLPVSADVAPLIAHKDKVKRQKCNDKLQEANNFDPSIGDIYAVSGWRKRALGPRLNDALILVDWALIKISDNQLFKAINDISTFGARLVDEFPEGVPCWRGGGKNRVDKIAPISTSSTMVFKQGRTTGLTSGVFGLLLPAATRMHHVPARLHHRGYVVFPPKGRLFFCRYGDSGSWCLNGDGEVVAMIIGGDEAHGTGFVTPFLTIVEDIAMELDVDAGSIKTA